jgi:RecJ-like exonuclease
MRTCSGKEHEAHLVNRLFPGGHRLRASVGGVDHSMSEPRQGRERELIECPYCDGDGNTLFEMCRYCSGMGTVLEEDTEEDFDD